MLRHDILYFFIICTCFAARDPPTINIPNQGSIVGKELSKSRVQKIYAFYGIPYAQPPLGRLRFAPPDTENLPNWEGVRNATDYAPSCLQNSDSKENLPFLQLINKSPLNTSEDCLYLNVFVPLGVAPDGNLATIIWFHPGNYTSGSPALWNPHTLVYRHQVIIVTFSWRLHVMGFFSTMDGEAPGNFGLMDQQAAMMWVKNNIKLFGGDPDNICLMGYGTGGVSIGLHMINPTSQPLFNKVIIMSANLLSPSVVKDPQEDKKLLDRFADQFGCIRHPTSQLIQCLRRAEGSLLIEGTSNVNWRPLLDVGLSNNTNPFISEHPKAAFQRGEFIKVPCLTGYTNMEEILDIPELESENLPHNMTDEFLQQILMDIVSADIPFNNNTDSCLFNHDFIFDTVMFFYGSSTGVKTIDELRKIIADFTTEKHVAASTFQHANYFSKEQTTFVYRFELKPITKFAIENIPEWVGVPHLFDLIYVWGLPFWPDLSDQQWDLRDKTISDIIMAFWTNFAKSSDPIAASTSYPIKWTPFTPEDPGILIIDNAFNMSNTQNINYKAFEFWNEYYPKVVEIGTTCCTGGNKGSLRSKLSNILLFLSLFFYLAIYK